MIKPGNYQAKICAYGIKVTSKGDAAPTIAFRVEKGVEEPATVYWQGSFKAGKGREIALKALVTCGLSDAHKIADLANGKESGLLDLNKELDIVVIHEARQDDPMKVYPKVEWINDSSDMKGRISKEEAASKIAGLGLENDLGILLKGKKVFAATAPVKHTLPTDDLSIPF